FSERLSGRHARAQLSLLKPPSPDRRTAAVDHLPQTGRGDSRRDRWVVAPDRARMSYRGGFIAALRRAGRSGGGGEALAMIASTSAPATGSTSICSRTASARNAASLTAAVMAARSAVTRSGGVSGGAMKA